MKEIIIKLLDNWNVDNIDEIKQVYATAWSIGDKYIVKAAENLESLKRNIAMMRALKEYGIPVAHPIQTSAGEDYIEYNGKYFLLMNKLLGTHILNIYETNYSDAAYKTGGIIANLHNAFAACEAKITFWNNSLLDEMEGWIYASLKADNFQYITEQEFETSLKELKECYNQLPKQLIHRDLHFGNLLFHNGDFSGYIDFDLSQKNIRIFDICYFLLGLLIDHEKDIDAINKWYTIISKFIEGYTAANPLTELEKNSISCIMKCIEILFSAYYINEGNEVLASGAANLFHFVKDNCEKIQYAVHNN